MDVAVAARAGRPTWLNHRTLLGAVLVLISLGGGRAVLENGNATVAVWVAGRDLAAGTTIDSTVLRVEHVRLSPRLAAAYVPENRDLSGYVVTRPLADGELVAAEWLSTQNTGSSRAITLPVDPEHAVGGALRPGELIDIFATFDAGDARARTVALARAVEVIDVVSAGGLVMGDKAVVGVTVSVSPEEAQRIAFATRSAQLDIARIDGSSDPSRRGVVTGTDF